MNNTKVQAAEAGDPSNTAIIYGTLSCPYGVIDKLVFIQMNPAQESFMLTAGMDGSTFYTQPLAVGISLKAIFFREKQSGGELNSFLGIQNRKPIDVRIEKPGLYFAGNLLFSARDKDNPDSGDYGFYPYAKGNEIDSLEKILKVYKGTAWEPIINSRIEELSK